MTINDLTKEELLELIACRGWNLSIKDNDIERVRRNSMTRKAKKMVDEACVEMKANVGPQNWPAYKNASAKFDRGMRLYDEASIFRINNKHE